MKEDSLNKILNLLQSYSKQNWIPSVLVNLGWYNKKYLILCGLSNRSICLTALGTVRSKIKVLAN